MSYLVDKQGFYGEFGGAYVPEILYATVKRLQEEYLPIIESEEFKREYMTLLRDYVGRPSPLYLAKRMSEKYGCQLYLKREDLNHTRRWVRNVSSPRQVPVSTAWLQQRYAP